MPDTIMVRGNRGSPITSSDDGESLGAEIELRAGRRFNSSRGEANLARARAALAVKRPAIAPRVRFWACVDIRASGCWEWTGAYRNPKGYGQFARAKRDVVLAHRYSWECSNGPIPDGLILLHACDNPCCVNPSHLRIGTRADNNRDMYLKGRARNKFSRRTMFPCGHPFAAPHLRLNSRGHRHCHTCAMDRQRHKREQAKAAQA